MAHADTVRLAACRPLFRQVVDLKRIRTADDAPDSLATRIFRTAWRRLIRGESTETVALETTVRVLVATQLSGIDDSILRLAGLDHDARSSILAEALAEAIAPLPAAVVARFHEILDQTVLKDLTVAQNSPERDDASGRAPGLPRAIDRLARQPRAGATRPGHPRILLEPAESHADHCLVTAVIGATLAVAEDAQPGPPFLAGLAHHLHNAELPDAGFAGEMLLGDHLDHVILRFRDQALASLPPELQTNVRNALTLVDNVDSPEARAFQAADVLDRVLEMEHHERVARFRLTQALDELDLVHPGPLKHYQDAVLREAGLLTDQP